MAEPNIQDKSSLHSTPTFHHEDWTGHSPPGGVVLGGKYFKGGQFIPKEDLDKASPEEIKQLHQAIDISKKYGPKQAKKIRSQLQKSNNQNFEQQKQFAQQIAQHVYVIDDGNLVGNKQHFGVLVIRNNTGEEPTLISPEIHLFSALQTKELHIINPSDSTVYKITNTEGVWWGNSSIAPDKNIFNEFAQSQYVKTDKIPIKDYNLLNNLSPKLQEVLNPPQNSPTANSSNVTANPPSPDLNNGISVNE